ncbi:MAG: DMT family transporter [Bacillota bacterium]
MDAARAREPVGSAPLAPSAAPAGPHEPAAAEARSAARFAAGVLLVLSSAVAFGAMPALARVAYAYGATAFTLLAARFAVAWAALAVVSRVAAARGPARSGGTLRRDRVAGLLLGAALYAGTAMGFFAALQFVPASVAALLFYTYPALVAAGSAGIHRYAPGKAQGAAVAAAVAGSALVAGASLRDLDGRGVVLALAAAASYAGYILLSHSVQARLGTSDLARRVSAGALFSSLAAVLIAGDSFTAIRAPGWAAAVTLGLVSTVYAVTAFLAGMARVGPTVASVLSAAEPVTALALAALVLGEHLAPAQAVGAALIVTAVVLVSVPTSGGQRGSRHKEEGMTRAAHSGASAPKT